MLLGHVTANAVHLRLSVLKAKHGNWIVEIYNKFQSDKGVTIIKSSFNKADITEAIEMVEFPEQDPFWFRNLAFH